LARFALAFFGSHWNCKVILERFHQLRVPLWLPETTPRSLRTAKSDYSHRTRQPRTNLPSSRSLSSFSEKAGVPYRIPAILAEPQFDHFVGSACLPFFACRSFSVPNQTKLTQFLLRVMLLRIRRRACSVVPLFKMLRVSNRNDLENQK